MSVYRGISFSVIFIIVVCCTSGAAGFEGPPRLGEWLGGEPANGYFAGAGLRKYVNSFTSYQFANPYPPGQDPLSRLEFPIDQWFFALKTGYAGPGWSAEIYGLTNITGVSRAMMQDSDWTDGDNPGQKTVFSESHCKMNGGFVVDLKVEAAWRFNPESRFRPLAGWRVQRFSFTTFDGIQFEQGAAPLELPGEGIEFKQTFYHYYGGAAFRHAFDGGRYTFLLPRMTLDMAVDYGFVTAGNEDLHLLRTGHRVTRENTRGHVWHASLKATFLYTPDILMELEGEFMRVVSHGSHQLTNPVEFLDISWDGAKVWSDQASVSMTAQISF
jgi:outer membrane protease